MDAMNPRKLYIGNIPSEYVEADFVADFSPFGRIVQVEFKGRFAFVEYDSSSAAADALAALTGMVRHGERLFVKAYRHIHPRNSYRLGRSAPDGSDRGVGQSKRTAFRVAVLGLHEKTSWQDLKDFGRRVGEVNFADVSRGPEGLKKGLLEFYDEATMNAAVRQLSGQMFLGVQVQVVPASTVHTTPAEASPRQAERRRSRSPRDEWDRGPCDERPGPHTSHYDSRRERPRSSGSPVSVRQRVPELPRGGKPPAANVPAYSEGQRSISRGRYGGGPMLPPSRHSVPPFHASRPGGGDDAHTVAAASSRPFREQPPEMDNHYRPSSHTDSVGRSLVHHDPYYRSGGGARFAPARRVSPPSLERSRTPRSSYRAGGEGKECYLAAPGYGGPAPRYAASPRNDPVDYALRGRDYHRKLEASGVHRARQEGNGVHHRHDDTGFRSEDDFGFRRRREGGPPSLMSSSAVPPYPPQRVGNPRRESEYAAPARQPFHGRDRYDGSVPYPAPRAGPQRIVTNHQSSQRQVPVVHRYANRP